MNEMQIFNNAEFGKIRTVIIDNEPWFVGKDVAEILGYTNPRKSIIDHVDEEDKTDGVTIRDSIGREQNPVCINESGLYSLILGSKLKSAKRFKHWVTSDVLPQIRRTGAYKSPIPANNPMKLLEAHYEAIKYVDTKVDTLTERVDEIEMNLPILPIEADRITTAAKKKGVAVLGGYDSAAYNNGSLRRKVYSNLYSNLKYNFGVSSYKAIKRCQCDKAIEIITEYKPPLFLKTEIELANAQMAM